jgi:hypothetical protein
MSQGTPAPWNRGPVVIVYGAILIISIAILRFAGRGWVGAITAGLVLAGVVTVLLVLAGGARLRARPGRKKVGAADVEQPWGGRKKKDAP